MASADPPSQDDLTVQKEEMRQKLASHWLELDPDITCYSARGPMPTNPSCFAQEGEMRKVRELFPPDRNDGSVPISSYTMYNLEHMAAEEAATVDQEAAPSAWTGVPIEVLREDVIDATIAAITAMTQRRQRPLVLSLANEATPGGSWTSGASAQEEQLWYRTTLPEAFAVFTGADRQPFSLDGNLAHYAPRVQVVRSNSASGYQLLDDALASHVTGNLLLSVVSIAALRQPAIAEPAAATGKARFSRQEDVEFTKNQMRLCLRIAKENCHRVLVLGAMGCGVFRNPPWHVASLWLEVLREPRFCCRHWDRIIFAVYGKGGNFSAFADTLHGQVIT